jgi:alpha-galactosidase
MGAESYWLSSWGVLTQMVGLCDACRIAQDAKPEWSGMQMQIVESARWFFAQRILYTNDPDHVCVRAPLEWSRTVLSLVSLSGGLYMLSDPVESYDAERIRIAQQTLPPLTTVAAETGPLDVNYAAFNWTKLHGFAFGNQQEKEQALKERRVTPEEEARHMAGGWKTAEADHPFSTLWAIHLDGAAGRWCVAGRFASLPLRASRLRISALALETGRPYLAFDFWRQKYLGQVTDALDVPALPLGHCQIVALRPALERPQLLSSSRHISQDAVSVKSQTWGDGALTLELEGVRGTTEAYWLHVPAGFKLAGVSGCGIKLQTGVVQTAGGVDAALPIEVEFPTGPGDTTTGTLTVRFSQRS